MNFSKTKKFEKEEKALIKKYPSLAHSLQRLSELLEKEPLGNNSRDFPRVGGKKGVQVVKVSVACREIKKKGVRLVYAYTPKFESIIFVELFLKSNKEREDKKRIDKLLNSLP